MLKKEIRKDQVVDRRQRDKRRPLGANPIAQNFRHGSEAAIPRMLKKILSILGPGVIAGAADDDPSGIATYSQAGGQFGYGQLWTALFMLPFMVGVQEACARIGAVTGKGIAAVVREHYSKPILYVVVLLVPIANTINIGADIGAMAAAANLLFPAPFFVFPLIFTTLILLLEILLSYKVYARILKWLVLSMLAYPITVFIVTQPWGTIVQATFLPHIGLNFQFLFIIIGVFGTTITPYMFFLAGLRRNGGGAKSALVRKRWYPSHQLAIYPQSAHRYGSYTFSVKAHRGDLCEFHQPCMPRMDKSKGLSQPLATLAIKRWECPGEIRLVLGTQTLGFVEQLNFWSQIGNAILGYPSQRRERTMDVCRTTKDPLVARGVDDHQLESPGITLVWTAPDIVD
jgi:Natural resistance-associated macrophage protein-like